MRFLVQVALKPARLRLSAVVIGSVAAVMTETSANAQVSDDEQVLMFPVAASPAEEGSGWDVPIHGWIFEPEDNDLFRSIAIEKLRDDLGLDAASAESATFKSRIRYLLRDNERGKRLRVEIGDGHTMDLTPSGPDGHVFGQTTLRKPDANGADPNGVLVTRVVLSKDDGRRFEGRVQLVGANGISVISDIDDTIKDTGVTDPRRLARSTFLEPFRPVPGMAERYAAWEEQGASFHYVSSSPWQLYEPIARFMDASGYPRGAFSLKRFRPKDESVLGLFASPLTTKPPVIESILDRWPQRTFLLVGDSGEKDPEVYGGITRKYGDRVAAIYIRDVTGEAADSVRYREAFRNVPRSKWRLFTDPADLADLPVTK
jgi:hypothetical protein